METQIQNMRIEGSENITYAVGRDINFYTEEAPHFYEPDLKSFQPPRFKSPQNADELTQMLQGQHLLVLAGDPQLDKSALARHLAWRLSEILSQATGQVEIREWNRLSGDPQSLPVKIRETENSTIFILPQIAPQDVGYDLPRLKESAGNRHFVVASTEWARSVWEKGSALNSSYLTDLSADGAYTPDDLTDILIEQLIAAKDDLPLGLLLDAPEPTTSFGGGTTIQATAAQLQTPSKIAVFVQLLCAETGRISSQRVEDLIQLACNNRDTVRQWYHAVLTPREQLLALGLSLFDGVFDDQFFAALETVVEEVWQRRDPSLRALDYCDLDNLRNFFNLIEIDEQTTKVESRLPDLRRTIFEVAWDSHRRQILTALPVLAEMARQSVRSSISQNYELYGLPMRSRQLRDVISETLSDVGIISSHAIQGSLLSLSSDSNWRVQAVAAEALARWHDEEYGKHDDLFDILDGWRRSTSLFVEEVEVEREATEEGEEENKEERSSGILANIRATMALTIGYAARYDPPNQLASALLDQLNQLSRDHSEQVRKRIAYFTLPMIVPLHLDQLRGTLRNMARYRDLVKGIGLSLARAYRWHPDYVLQIIETWRAEAQHASGQSGSSEITQREGLLAVVALTYGHIELTEEIGPLTADETFSRLREMLEEERSQFVRSTVVYAIALQASDYFEKVEPLLYEFVHVVTTEERNAIVRILTNIYLKQRRELEDGEDTIEVGSQSYPVWVETERSQLTKVEEAMFRWIKNPSNPLAQQIATQAFVSFSTSFDREERRQVAGLKKEQERATARAKEEEEGGLKPLVRGLRRGGLFVDRLIPWLVTINAPEHREIIRGLLPEIVNQARADRELMNLVLERWPRLSRDQEIKDLTKRLKRGLWLSKNMNWIVVAVVLLLTFLTCQCFCLLSSLLNSI